MPKDTKTLGNSKARACESLGFVHKKGCARVLTHLPYYLLPPCSITDEQGDTEHGCKRVGKSGDKVCVTRQAWIRKR